jgi:thiaminase
MPFTHRLLALDEDAYKRATESPFLAAAARGAVSKKTLGQWLGNDRLYIHAYIQGTGRLLSFLELPVTAAASASPNSYATRLLDWCVEALANVRREERFFIDTASRFGIVIDLPLDATGNKIPWPAKLEGLRRFEDLFRDVRPRHAAVLPWLEAAVLFWGTEKCYLDAWSWASSQQANDGRALDTDADGGALRTEFIPNWSSAEFSAFVDQLGALIDAAVKEQVQKGGEGVGPELLRRAEVVWRELLRAEETFWPAM